MASDKEPTINIIKLSVGSACVEDLEEFQERRLRSEGRIFHRTRMTPKREQELLAGGSLYWVIKGQILARQPIIGLSSVQCDDGISRCDIVLKPRPILVRPTPKRPFQGWRYLKPEDAPPDLGKLSDAIIKIPPKMRAELAELCLI